MRSVFNVVTMPLATLLFASFVLGCPGREVARVDPRQTKEQEKLVPVQLNRDIDILFVIDNSGSMREEQDSLATNFNRFINVLQTIEGGLPNVHLGVISTDLGAGPFGIEHCNASGDNGNLLHPTTACNYTNDGKPYIVHTTDADGMVTQNYDGSLADTFSCVARLGTNGCGFEQPLEAIRRALDNNPQNMGFLRDDAFLAVIIISDEDDCSTEDINMFDSSQDDIMAPLGNLSSFRCFEFGVECEPDTPRTPGPRQNCNPRDDSDYMYGVDEYISFLRGVKRDPNQIIVAGIIGNRDPVTVGIEGSGEDMEAKLQPSCSIVNYGEAAPAIRLHRYLEGFPQRNSFTSICNENLSDALTQIAELLRKVIGNPCLDGDLADGDPNTPGLQPECTVSDVYNLGLDGQDEKLLPPCSASSGLPCYQYKEDSAQCGNTATQMSLVVCRGGEEDDAGCPSGSASSVPSGTTTVVRCVAN